jgi:selenocysteine lyase/cysteine desulfurase
MRQTSGSAPSGTGLAKLVGHGGVVRGVDGVERPYIDLDAAASTGALVEVADEVNRFLPSYASVHRGAGWRSRESTSAYEQVRADLLRFAQREERDDVAIICRNTTEAINHLAFRLELESSDVVLTTVVEHHANLLPWRRYATMRYVECAKDGTFGLEDVRAGLESAPRPRLLALSGASNVSGWIPPVDAIIELAHERGVPVLVDGAQLAPHRPLPVEADYLAWSGHKMYAPYGAGVLVAPRAILSRGDPFLAGGGAVDLVSLDEVLWSAPPEREEAGSPNVVGAVAFGAAARALLSIGWPAIASHDEELARLLRGGLEAIDGVTVLGPDASIETLPVASFVVEGVHHALVAARLAAEWGIGVRHGCFCAHPYLLRLLGMTDTEVAAYREEVRRGDHSHLPGATRASASIATTRAEIEQLLAAVGEIASGDRGRFSYAQQVSTGDFYPTSGDPAWAGEGSAGGGCASG